MSKESTSYWDESTLVTQSQSETQTQFEDSTILETTDGKVVVPHEKDRENLFADLISHKH